MSADPDFFYLLWVSINAVGLQLRFSIENVYLFPELTVGVVKCMFCYKGGILIETDPLISQQLYAGY